MLPWRQNPKRVKKAEETSLVITTVPCDGTNGDKDMKRV